MRGFNLPKGRGCGGGVWGVGVDRVNSCNPDLLLENKNTERQWIHILFYQKFVLN